MKAKIIIEKLLNGWISTENTGTVSFCEADDNRKEWLASNFGEDAKVCDELSANSGWLEDGDYLYIYLTDTNPITNVVKHLRTPDMWIEVIDETRHTFDTIFLYKIQ